MTVDELQKDILFKLRHAYVVSRIELSSIKLGVQELLKHIGYEKNINKPISIWTSSVLLFTAQLTHSAHDIVLLKALKIAELVEELLANLQFALIQTTDLVEDV